MTTEQNVSRDVDTITSEPTSITLSSGSEVKVERLRTRQLFRLLKVLTRGAGPALQDLQLRADTPAEEFGGQLLMAIIISIPEAENEAIEFIQSMVVPVDHIERPRTAQEKKRSEEALDELMDELDNPDIIDTIAIFEQVIKNEAGELQALGKRLAALWNAQSLAMTAKEKVIKKVKQKASSKNASDKSTPMDS